MLLTVPGLPWEHEQQERVGNLGNHSQASRQQPQLHQPKNPQPSRYLLYRALEALVPYIVGTWGVREF